MPADSSAAPSTALDGLSVVVTGAGRGIGRACARAAASAGAQVIVNDVDAGPAEEVAGEIRRSGGRALAHAADVSDWEQAGLLVRRAVEEFGGLDGLVNNAGCFGMARAEEQDPAVLRRIVEVNLLGSAHCGIHALRVMLRAGGGSIVNVTSGAQAGLAEMSAYAASKGAIASLTYTWAMEVADRGIRVNALSPLARTRMTEAMLDHRGLPERERVEMRRHMPEPEVNAPVVVYLLSDSARAVTGQVVRIDGSTLSLVSHPMIRLPTVALREGTPAAVAEAFETTLHRAQVPLGLVRAEIRPPEPDPSAATAAADETVVST
jgi:NAD(P)-dependent dehydrogenase (short-subunit alcohol dehydrogenase family)